MAKVSRKRRALTFAGLACVWSTGYFWVGRHPLRSSFNPTTLLDGLIPFVSQSVWIYVLAIILIASPVALIHEPQRFCKFVVAYAFALLLALSVFALFPSQGVGLRPSGAELGTASASAAALRALWTIDPATNLFPSLHVALGSLAALALAAEFPQKRTGLAICWALLIASVCCTKQHAVLDVAGGLATAAVALASASLAAASRRAGQATREGTGILPSRSR